MKKLENSFVYILSIIAITPLFIFFIFPYLIITFPKRYFQKKEFKKLKLEFEKKYTEFLTNNNRMNFFCYNNRKNSKKFIEENIIPKLSDNIKIVYLNGRKIELEQNLEFISEALYKLKNYQKFPHLMKIRNGKLIDKSINNSFYNVQNLKKDKTKLLIKINLFFELNVTGIN